MQPGDTVLYKGEKHTKKGVQNLGTYLKLDNTKVVSVKQVKLCSHAGGYVYARI